MELSADFRRLSTLSLNFLGSFLSYPVELKCPCSALMAPVTAHQQDMMLHQKTECQGALPNMFVALKPEKIGIQVLSAIDVLNDLNTPWVQQAANTRICLSYCFNSPYVSA